MDQACCQDTEAIVLANFSQNLLWLAQPSNSKQETIDNHYLRYCFYFTSQLFSLCNKQAIVEHSDSKPRQPKESPVILYHNDTLTSRVHHLEPANGLNPQEAELRMLDFFPQSRLKELPTVQGREIVEREARANELRYFCQSEMTSTSFLERALKQFAFEGMLLKNVFQNGEVVDLREVDDAFLFYANLWDHPYSKLSEFQRVRFPSEGEEKVKVADEFNSSPLASFRNLDEWCFVEHFDRKTLIQASKVPHSLVIKLCILCSRNMGLKLRRVPTTMRTQLVLYTKRKGAEYLQSWRCNINESTAFSLVLSSILPLQLPFTNNGVCFTLTLFCSL